MGGLAIKVSHYLSTSQPLFGEKVLRHTDIKPLYTRSLNNTDYCMYGLLLLLTTSINMSKLDYIAAYSHVAPP